MARKVDLQSTAFRGERLRGQNDDVLLLRSKMGLPFEENRDRLAIEKAKAAKTAVAGVSHDDVIKDFDLEKLTSSNEITSDFDVGFGRFGLSARMIVRDDDGGCACHDCQSKDFAGMTEDCIHRANGHQIMTFDPPTGVEDEHHQTFTFRVKVRMSRDVCLPIGGCLIRCFALLHGIGCGTFPQ